MDQEILVKELRNVLARLEKKEGPVTLLLLASSDAGVDNVWNVIVSSPAFDDIPRSEATRRVSEYLRKALDQTLWPSIGRTTVLRTDDSFVQGVLRSLPQAGAGLTIKPLNVSGVEISAAVIIEAKKLAA
jgi:hypothetical protein